jgi:hypothetical protein
MTYFKIGGKDYSTIVSSLKIDTNALYETQTNANGSITADFIRNKRTIEVGIIPLDNVDMSELLNNFIHLLVRISFLNPLTNTIEENVQCIMPSSSVDYYTIQIGKVSYKGLTLKFIEL